MLSDGYQAYDFLSILYPKVKKAFPSLLVSCCDSTGARQQRDLLYELNRAAAGQRLFDINTYHNYQSDVKRPFDDLLPHNQPTLETEWSDGGSNWTPTWDVSGNNFEGFQWAIYLHNAFRNNVAGWLNWWCTWSGPDAPLIVVNGTDYQVAARLWAMSGYFRFARPGAVRIGSTSDVEEVYVTAWENANGTVAVPVVNAAHYAYTIHVDLVESGVNYAVAYLTDNGHNGTAGEGFGFEGGKFSAVVEPRSMKTWFLSVV
jgi:glucosylceramidase